jgi:glycosyltransferase involved in cell wall biosynthesis
MARLCARRAARLKTSSAGRGERVPKTVITLPVYRAERTLAQTLAEIPDGVADRLILVDDASPDNTAQVARELGVDVHVHAENLGYGGTKRPATRKR